MKRACIWVLILTLIIGGCFNAAAAKDVIRKDDKRITAYVGYLKELFANGYKGKITHVGVVDINRDYLPELFYIYRTKSGVCQFHFCYFDAGDVGEYDIDENYIGVAPGNLELTRYSKVGSSDYCWLLKSTGKNAANNRNERLFNIFTRSGTTLRNQLKFRRTWKGTNTDNRYFLNGKQTVKSAFDSSLNDFLNVKWKIARDDLHFKNRGIIRKVASPSTRSSLLAALNDAAAQWKLLPPVLK